MYIFESFDQQAFVRRFGSVMEMVRRGATEGERTAAKTAMAQMLDTFKREVKRMREPNSGVTESQIDNLVNLVQQIKDGVKPQTQTTRPSEPRDDFFDANEWSLHYAIAAALGGTVHPFDKYQGPYIIVPGGRLWINDDQSLNGGRTTVIWNELNNKMSEPFWPDDDTAAIKAARSVLIKPKKRGSWWRSILSQ